MTQDFFSIKKPWSPYKDMILGYYLKPYLPKVCRLKKPVVVVDCFAGPGRFEDGSVGSPLIIAKALQKSAEAGQRVSGLFIEEKRKYFRQLENALSEYLPMCQPVNSSFEDCAERISELGRQNTVFVYVDPYGIKPLRFAALAGIYANLAKGSSIEVLLNLNSPSFIRNGLAALKCAQAEADVASSLLDEDVDRTMTPEDLDGIAGGNYWRDIVSSETPFADKEERFVGEYMRRMRDYFEEVCSYAIKEKYEHTVPKYRLVFGSRHPDAFMLMNDAIGKARDQFLGKQRVNGYLFDMRAKDEVHDPARLRAAILDAATGAMTRKQLVLAAMHNVFAEYSESEHKRMVGALLKEKRLHSRTGKTRINDDEVVSVTPFDQDIRLTGNGSDAVVRERGAEYKPGTNGQEHSLVRELWAVRGSSDLQHVRRIVDRSGLPLRWLGKPPETNGETGVDKLMEERNVLLLRDRKSAFVDQFQHPLGRCARFYKLTAYNSCNFWCEYCYLYLTFRNCPVSTHFVNYDRMLRDIEAFDAGNVSPALRVLNLGELGDPLAVDDITGFAEHVVPFMPEHAPRTRLLFLTKSDCVGNLLNLDHGGQTIVSFSVNTDKVWQFLEHRTPSPAARLMAAGKAQQAGYEIRLRIDPVIRYSTWQKDYVELVDRVFSTVQPSRITIGEYRPAQTLSNHIQSRFPESPLVKVNGSLVSENGKMRYPREQRLEMFTAIIDAIRRRSPDIPVALCKEEASVWKAVGLNGKGLRCNCVG